MNTIKMRKGDLFADICNSSECIENAKKEGFFIVEEPKPVVVTEEKKPEVQHVKRTTKR